MRVANFVIALGILSSAPYAGAQRPVGFTVLVVHDSSRSWERSVGAEAAGRAGPFIPRPVRISIWYPARSATGVPMRVADYLTHATIRNSLARDVSRRLDARDKQTFVDQVLDGDATKYAVASSRPMTAVRDAESAGGQAPLVLYSAGLNSFDTDNAILAETLASQGYVVATVAQVGPTAERLELSLTPGDVETQVRDLEVALTTLRRRTNVDPRRIAVAGWSIGAVATLLLQMRHPEVGAVVALDPSYAFRNHPSRVTASSGFAVERMTVPLLVMAQSSASGTDSVIDLLSHATRDVVRFPGVVHEDFAMGAELAAAAGARTAKRSTQHALHASRDVVTRVAAFLDAHLRGDSAKLEIVRRLRVDDAIPAGSIVVRHIDRRRPLVGAAQLALLLERLGYDSALSLLGIRPGGTAVGLPIREPEVNVFAYALLGGPRRSTAVGLMRLNAAAFPASANAFDSLADGLIALGDRAGAATAYRRVLDLLETDASLSSETREILRTNATRFLKAPP